MSSSGTQLSDDVLDVLKKTIEAKKSDSGLAVMLEPGAATLVAGGAVVDGDKLEWRSQATGRRSPEERSRGRQVDQARRRNLPGRCFHTFSMPTPDPKLVPLMGERWTWSSESPTTRCSSPPATTPPRRSRRSSTNRRRPPARKCRRCEITLSLRQDCQVRRRGRQQPADQSRLAWWPPCWKRPATRITSSSPPIPFRKAFACG